MGTLETQTHWEPTFGKLNGLDVVSSYGDPTEEWRAFAETAGVIDISSRGRLCFVGQDRHRFLHGQLTNEVAGLQPGEGCFAGLVSAKGKLEMEVHVFCLEDEILVDFEPGYFDAVRRRFEAYVIGDDVEIVDASPFYGMAGVHGPRSEAVLKGMGLGLELPAKDHGIVTANDPVLGLIYVTNNPRLGVQGFDVLAPVGVIPELLERLRRAAAEFGGRACGFDAWENKRVEAGIPRYGVDMDATNLAPETGLERRGISYSKGCYIGQEIIARIRTYGQVAKALRVLEFSGSAAGLPARGDALWTSDRKEVGYVTSVIRSLADARITGLGYVRKEFNEVGREIFWKGPTGEFAVKIKGLPYSSAP